MAAGRLGMRSSRPLAPSSHSPPPPAPPWKPPRHLSLPATSFLTPSPQPSPHTNVLPLPTHSPSLSALNSCPGFREQTKGWPVQPVEVAIRWLKSKPPGWVVADLGCGDAQLAASVPQVRRNWQRIPCCMRAPKGGQEIAASSFHWVIQLQQSVHSWGVPAEGQHAPAACRVTTALVTASTICRAPCRRRRCTASTWWQLPLAWWPATWPSCR